MMVKKINDIATLTFGIIILTKKNNLLNNDYNAKKKL